MRVSADPKDEDYFLLSYERGVCVFVDGAIVQSVLEADEEAGFVIHHPRGSDGKRIRAPSGGFVVDRLVGKVEIVGQLRPKKFWKVIDGPS